MTKDDSSAPLEDPSDPDLPTLAARGGQDKNAGDCSTCRHRSEHRRLRVADVAFDEIVEWTDEEEIVYTCRAPSGVFVGQEIGTKPVRCSSYASSSPTAVSDSIDALMARFEERHKNKEKDGR